jgi:pilus assembly protein CpaB
MTRPSALTTVTVLALLLAGCASLLAYNYLSKQTAQPFQGVTILSAAADLPIGSKLDASRVKLAAWPKEALPAGYYTDAKAVAGRVVVRPLSAGDIVTESKLMPLNVSGGIMTYMVPQGHRAVTVAVNEVAGVAGFITPNSRVDVVLTTPRPGAKDDQENISKIILQNVPVLATGQVAEQKEGKPAVVPTVTLDLTPENAEKLIVGAKKGSLQLLLRNVVDVAAIGTPGATVSNALGSAEARPAKLITRSAPAPRRAAPARVAAAPLPARFSMEIIKGGAKATREFPQD